MYVSAKGFICHSKFAKLMLKKTKSLETNDIQSWKMPHLGIFHETKLDVSKDDKYIHKYVFFHYKYHLSQ